MQTTTQVFSDVSKQNNLAIPTEIWDAVHELAGKLGLSANELFATALSDFIRRYGEVDITAELDKEGLTKSIRMSTQPLIPC